MKYAVLFFAVAAGVPALSFLATLSARLRGWLLAALVFSTVLGDVADVNFATIPFYRGPDRSLGITLTDLLAWSLSLSLLFRFPRKICWLPYNSVWMFLLFGVGLMQTWSAPVPFWGTMTLAKWIRAYAVYWCAVNCLRAGIEREYVWKGLLAIGLLITVVALKQKFLGGIYRISGPFDHSNLLPIYVQMILPVLLIWGLCDKTMRALPAVTSVVASLGLVFSAGATYSRAGLGLALLGLLGSLAIANLRAISARVVIASAAILLGMVIGGAAVAKAVIDRFQHAPTESLETRVMLNQAAARMLREHAFGVGLNNYSYVLTHKLDKDDRRMELLSEKEDKEQASFCHHIYWLTAAETGYLGLAVFLVMIARFLWLTGVHAWRSSSMEGILLSAYFLAFLAVHLQGFSEWALRSTPAIYLFAVSSGVCVAFAQTVREQARPRPPAEGKAAC